MDKMEIDDLGKWHEKLVSTKNLVKTYKQNSHNGVLAQFCLSAMVVPAGRNELERTVGIDKSVYLELKRDVEPVVDQEAYTATIDIEESTPVALKIYNGIDTIRINPIYMQELQTIMLKIMDDVESTLDAESKRLKAEVEKSFDV